MAFVPEGRRLIVARHEVVRQQLAQAIYPGLKPWAEPLSHLRGINHSEGPSPNQRLAGHQFAQLPDPSLKQIHRFFYRQR